MGDSEGTTRTRSASRSAEGATASTALTPPLEDRTILVAQGIERQNRNLPDDWKVPGAVIQRLRDNGHGDGIDEESATRLVFTSRRQGVRYTVRVVTRKDEYKAALETEGWHVIYGGHARYGRGPCFGDDPGPGNDWGRGTNTTQFGIFPMAYPYLAVPVEEILEHGYTAFPVPTTVSPLPAADRAQNIRSRRLRAIRVSDLGTDILPQLGGVTASDEVWGYGEVGRLAAGATCVPNPAAVHLVLYAGWQDTGQPIDLGSTELRCRVLCHFGCSSFDHNYKVVRRLKNWRREGNNRYAYWTTAPSNSGNRIPWIYHLLTYNKHNAFKSWHPHILYALGKTNRELLRDGYQFI